MPMREGLDLDGQIEVLRSGVDPATWSLERLGLPAEWRDTNVPGNTGRCQDAVDRLFTVTREEVEGALAGLGLQPEQLGHVYLEPGSRDGTYCVTRGGKTEVYLQERGGRWAEVVFDDPAEARRFLLNLWLPVWLHRLRVPCRLRNGKSVVDF